MEPFADWAALIAYLDQHSNIVHYQAPLDRYPLPVVIMKRFKNGKLRIRYHDVAFTADRGHLDRFRRRAP